MPLKMGRFLYIFGFQTPLQRNNSLAQDDEDSEAIWITAESDQAALDWGREISERFVGLLFNDSSVSWKRDEFAHWLEDENKARSSSDTPAVRTGEFPDFDQWLRRHSS